MTRSHQGQKPRFLDWQAKRTRGRGFASGQALVCLWPRTLTCTGTAAFPRLPFTRDFKVNLQIDSLHHWGGVATSFV